MSIFSYKKNQLTVGSPPGIGVSCLLSRAKDKPWAPSEDMSRNTTERGQACFGFSR